MVLQPRKLSVKNIFNHSTDYSHEDNLFKYSENLRKKSPGLDITLETKFHDFMYFYVIFSNDFANDP